MRINLILGILLLLLTASCRSGRLQKKGIDLGKNQADSLAPPNEPVIMNPIFTELRFRSEAAISSDVISQKVPITLHVRRDSIIWASVSIGLELVRAKITKDSLVFLDRFNRKAYIGTWDELSRSAGFALNFNLLQALLTGGMLFDTVADDEIIPGNTVSMIRQVRNGVTFESRIDNSVRKVFEVRGEDPGSSSSLDLGYRSFISQSGQLIPSVISLLLSGRNNMRLDIIHSKIDFVESGLSFSFSVPASYKTEPLPGI